MKWIELECIGKEGNFKAFVSRDKIRLITATEDNKAVIFFTEDQPLVTAVSYEALVKELAEN